MLGQLQYKCERYGSRLVEVPARNTSLTCPECGYINPRNKLPRAVFICIECGHADYADINAAIDIRERGIELAPAGGHPVAGRKASKRFRTWRQPAQEKVV